jgi:hypothetical protein
MKITDNILLELGFVYNSINESFDYELTHNNYTQLYLIVIIKNDTTGEYWLYWKSQHPGYKVNTVMDIVRIIHTKGIEEGKLNTQSDIKQILGL